MKNRWLSTMACVLGSVFYAQAAIITDDFSTVGDPLPGWSGGTNFYSDGATAISWQTNGAPAAVAWNPALETVSGNGTNFNLSVGLSIASGGRLTGVAFNVQDEDNFYFISIVTGTARYSFYKVANGAVTELQRWNDASVTFTARTNYTLNITSDIEGAYSFFITETGQSTCLNPTTSYTVGDGAPFIGGYGGLYTHGNGSAFRYDNFSLEVTRAEGVVITDGFGTAGNPLPGWSGSTNFYSDGAAAVIEQASGAPPAIAWNTGLETVSGNGTSFDLSVDLSIVGGYRITGVAFNVQDATNYYFITYVTLPTVGRYTFQKVVDGVRTELEQWNDATLFFSGRSNYTINVMSDTEGTYDFFITETGQDAVLNPTTSYTVDGTPFAGGYGGLYTGGNSSIFTYDNFSLTVVSDGYAGWAGGWGVDIGVETNDYDSDGLNNLYEYGLGGDPTNPVDQGTSPVFSVLDDGGSNVFRYVYPQLSAPDSGLSYYLELSANLVYGGWSNMGYAVTGTNVTGGELAFVTNVTDTVGAQKFIRLIIESDMAAN